MRLHPRFAFLFCLGLLIPSSALAQWKFSGTPLAYTAPNSQNNMVVCPDGAGGAIMAWEDTRNDPGNVVSDIYAQRINSSGVVQWTTNGVAVCTAVSFQASPRIVSDNAGGAIIVWRDYRFGVFGIYGQRLNASGVAQWTANGVGMGGQGNDDSPTLIADASGGAIVTWTDGRNLNNQDIYAQRLSNTGVLQWTGTGVPVCAATGNQGPATISTDGSTGAIIVWEDARGPAPVSVYAQKINVSGVPQWTANGVALCALGTASSNPTLVVDGTGAAIITWTDHRVANANIFAQRLNSAGAAQWTANGVDVCSAAGDQGTPLIVTDGSQGGIITFTDDRDGDFENDLYAQRIGVVGNKVWAALGVPVTTATGDQNFHQVVSDGAGGVNVIWVDSRNPYATLYAQRLDGSGTQLLTTDGVLMSSQVPGGPVVTSDGGGNIITGMSNSRVYAQRLETRYGYWGKPEPALFAAKDVPADQGGKVRLEWYASGYDVIGQNAITYYTIWRAIDQAAFAAASAAGVPVVKLNDVTAGYKGAAIRREKIQAIDYFWTLVGTQNAFRRYAYSFDASTSFDSTAANPATNRFQILSHAGSDIINFPSNVLTGRSVDNLAPPAPLFLTAQRIGNYVYLKWNGVHVPDLDKYSVYRATSTGVTPIPPNFLANDNDTLLTDSNAPTSALYYIVTASDIHQNQGVKSNEASVGATTGVGGNLPPVTALTVLQNHPNPFASETHLQVGLPARGDVRVEIYDVAGRRVRDVTLAGQAKGWNTLRLDALDDRGRALPSGVYFYRVHAGAETVTRKMVIAR